MAEKGQSAAEQVKALVQAAEQIRAEAERDAKAVGEAAARLAERGVELERRLDELAGSVREALAALKEDVERLREAAAGAGAVVDAPAALEDPATRVEPDVDDELIAEVEAMAARAPEVEAPAAPEGARLLALKMALDGHPREETAGYLRDNFELDDPEALLDEVYARAGR
jgi:hypothetical protein